MNIPSATSKVSSLTSSVTSWVVPESWALAQPKDEEEEES